jgi:hypothetical protein
MNRKITRFARGAKCGGARRSAPLEGLRQSGEPTADPKPAPSATARRVAVVEAGHGGPQSM